MEIKQFTQKSEHDVVMLWNKCLPYDPVSLDKFRKQALYDDNFDESLSWSAYHQGRLAGFIMATKRKFPYLERGLEEERGWINVLFVDPEFQRQKIGKKLLELAESELRKRGAKNITLGAYSPGYFFPGIDEENYKSSALFFQAHHYQRKETHYSMGMNLKEYRMPENIKIQKKELENKGYRFLEFQECRGLELLKFLKEEFGGGWKRSALMAMRDKTAEDVIWIVENPNHDICGFCMHAMDGNPERFGPIGIARDERNSRLGSVLLHLQIKKMKNKGCGRMFFMTTDENGRRFYERNGLKLIRTYIDYRKEL